MKEAYFTSESLVEFAAAREQSAHPVSEPESRTTLGVEHEDVEKLVSEEGNELLRRFSPGHLHLPASREATRKDVRGRDGRVRTRCREGCEPTLMTLFGEVLVMRKGYGRPGVSSVCALDGRLNLPPDRYSHGLLQRVSQATAKGSFAYSRETGQSFRRSPNIGVCRVTPGGRSLEGLTR